MSALSTTVDEDPSETEGEAQREFGGARGAAALMIGSHVVLYYLWYALRVHGGAAPLPDGVAGIPRFLGDWWQAVATQAAPTWPAAALYLGFLAVHAVLSAILPGIPIKGLPIAHLGGRRLDYNVNGLWAWYLTLIAWPPPTSAACSRWTGSTTSTVRS